MRALVTGADGFVGRHLLRHLTESGDVARAAAGIHFLGSDIDGGCGIVPDKHDGKPRGDSLFLQFGRFGAAFFEDGGGDGFSVEDAGLVHAGTFGYPEANVQSRTTHRAILWACGRNFRNA